MPSSPAPRYAGLDGLRAVAVLLVVVYHLFPSAFLHSGFVGVDAFFVISGFLITSLLLRERAATGAGGSVTPVMSAPGGRAVSRCGVSPTGR